MNDGMSLSAASSALREATRRVVKKHSIWYLLQAGLMVLAGVVALIFPLVSSIALMVFLGWLLIISGIVQGIGLVGATQVPHFWLQLVSVVLSVIIGVVMISNPGVAVGALVLLLIVFFMVEGISKVIFSLTVRPLPHWGSVFASGALGVVLSILLLSSPGMALWLLGVFVGVQLIGEGVSLGALAWFARRSA